MSAIEMTEIAELVEDHLGRGARGDIGWGALCSGLAKIGRALQEVQGRSQNWGLVLEQLRGGVKDVEAGRGLLGAALDARALSSFADRQVAFATLLEHEIVRLQAGESTLV